MNKLFDLRFVIGIFFLVIGVLLLLYSFLSKAEVSMQSINRYCGTAFTIFGLIMLLISSKKVPEA
jgi:hypothetical protein